MKIKARVGFIAALAVTLSSLSCSQGRSEFDTVETPAARAARLRQEAIKSIEVRYRVTEVVSPGAASAEAPVLRKDKPARLVPAKETTLKSISRLILDGAKIRVENHHPIWYVETGDLRENHLISVFNGDNSLLYFPDGIGSNSKPSGSIMQHARNHEIKSHQLTPITMAFRGFSRHMTPFLIEVFRPSGVKLPIRSRPCEEYTDEPSPGRIVSCWLDSERDFLVVRLRKQENGKLTEQLDVDYREHPTCGWVPQSWTRNSFGPDGAVKKMIRVDVLEFNVNESQNAELFEIRFPPGVMVGDQRNFKDYLVQEDGSMREVSPTGELLPDKVDQPGTPWHQRHRWLLVSLGAGAILIFVLFVARRFRVGKKRTA